MRELRKPARLARFAGALVIISEKMLGDSHYFGRSNRFRDRQVVFPQSLQMKFDGFPDKLFRVFLSGASRDHSWQDRERRRSSPLARLLIDDNVVHHFKPACFRALFNETVRPMRPRVRASSAGNTDAGIQCAIRALGYRPVISKTNGRARDASARTPPLADHTLHRSRFRHQAFDSRLS